jgi:NCAIR mutase (PurE)-related protein
MRRADLERLLEEVRGGDVAVPDALARLANWPGEDLGFAVVDHGRELRTGIPEVVLAEGKTREQVAVIARRIWARSRRLLVTRADAEVAAAVLEAIPGARHNPIARTVAAGPATPSGRGVVAVVCAGTGDLPVAEEAAESLAWLGEPVERVYDVGVAGLHRLAARLDTLRGARAVIVVAGMEGALPSVVAGLVDRPVIGVPTATGYGASFGGLAALLAMLNSCAAGLAVVNIDNGFGAACVARRMVTSQEPAARDGRGRRQRG